MAVQCRCGAAYYMIIWRKHSAALIGNLTLVDETEASVVLIGSRNHAKGAMILIPQPGDAQPAQVPLKEALARITPEQTVAILAVQERCFGTSGLPPFTEFERASS